MGIIKLILVFILGLVVGSFFPNQSQDALAKLRDMIFTREKKQDVIVLDAPESKPKTITRSATTTSEPKIVRKRPTTEIYTVQVASFKDLNQANAMVNKLIKEEYNAYIAPIDLAQRNGCYRVCVGESSTREQANQQFSALKGKFKDSFIQAF